MNRALRLHKEAVIFDATCPLANVGNWYELWFRGGATVIAPTIALDHSPAEAFSRIAVWLERMARDDRFMLIEHVDQFYEAKEKGRWGILFHFQNTLPFGKDLSLVWAFRKLGLRVVQLCYNVKNFVGDGCDERTDCGLSRFGVKLIKELNKAGIVVDLSHTGHRTTLEAIEVSERPPVFTHANVRAVCDTPRNLTDEQIKAVAKAGGVIGMNGYPAFVARKPEPTVQDLIKHVKYIVDLVGVDHVGLGIDYYEGMAGVASDEEAQKIYDGLVASGAWKPDTYPPPPWYYPLGMRRPEELPNFTAALVKGGFSDDDIKKVLGLNFLRVFKEVWR